MKVEVVYWHPPLIHPSDRNRINLQRAREKARAEGKCICCRKMPAAPMSTCQSCLNGKRAQAKRNRDKGRCKCGRKPTRCFKRCLKCRKWWRVKNSRRYRRKLEAGLCGRGACTNPRRPGRVYCAEHAARYSTRKET